MSWCICDIDKSNGEVWFFVIYCLYDFKEGKKKINLLCIMKSCLLIKKVE